MTSDLVLSCVLCGGKRYSSNYIYYIIGEIWLINFFTKSSCFRFFVVANAIACAYAAISLILTLANRNGKKGIATLIILFDLIMVALLFSAIGAAGAIGLMGFKGNSHVQWKKVCNVFDKFCDQGAASIGLSGAAAGAFFVLVVLAIFNLHKKH